MASPPSPLHPAHPAPDKRAGWNRAAIFALLATLVLGSWAGVRVFLPRDAQGAAARFCPAAPTQACPGPSRLDEAVCTLIHGQTAGSHPDSMALLAGGVVSLLWLPWLAAAAARMGRRWPLLVPAGLLAPAVSVQAPLSLLILAAAVAFSLRSLYLLLRWGHARARLSSALALAFLLISTRLAAPVLALCSLCVVGVALREEGWVARAAAALTLFFPAIVLAAGHAYVRWILCQ